MPNIKIKNKSGQAITYNNINKIKIPEASGGSPVLYKNTTLTSKTISANGTYNASDDSADGYDVVNVMLPVYDGSVS